ncbi:MAG: phosphatidylcholine/phosphatidylserine synthase [Spirochaetaceae bacterium]|nr:phosphatidylcholine/phosphatidylserine synthase [Spirochaetaceae bacterium]
MKKNKTRKAENFHVKENPRALQAEAEGGAETEEAGVYGRRRFKRPPRLRGARAYSIKSRRLKYIAVFPSLITIVNGVCGFLAVVYASSGGGEKLLFPFSGKSFSPFMISACLIYLGMIADVLDGRVARLTKTTSGFGGQLDSLCDAISFGLAPAFLVLKASGEKIGAFPVSKFSIIEDRTLLMFAIVYVSCAIIRLARFNVENKEEESAHMYFSGLPTPPAAAVLVSFIVLQQSASSASAVLPEALKRLADLSLIYFLPFLMLFCGFLMVSRVKYPHVVNHLLRGKKPFNLFIIIFLVLLIVVWNIHLIVSQCVIFLGFLGFALSGLLRPLFKFKKSRPPAEPPVSPPVD